VHRPLPAVEAAQARQVQALDFQWHERPPSLPL
jgi:hypothetical protein